MTCLVQFLIHKFVLCLSYIFNSNYNMINVLFIRNPTDSVPEIPVHSIILHNSDVRALTVHSGSTCMTEQK